MPEQNLSDGKLVVQIVEGSLEGVTSNDLVNFSGLYQVFPVKPGQLLNLRDLEQGLENINRLQSLSATMNLLPGEALGRTRVEITQKRSKLWQGQIRGSNSGQHSTGEQQLQTLLSWDDPLGLYDYSYLSYQVDSEFRRDKKYSESLAWHWDIPIGYWKVGLDLSRFKYLRQIEGKNLSFSASGRSERQTLSIDRVLFRDADSKLQMKWALTRKKTKNFVEDVLLDVSSRTLGVSDLTAQYEQYFGSGAFLLSELSYSRGLDAFGSPRDDELVGEGQKNAAKAQFDRYQFLLNYRHPFQWKGQSLQYKTQWKTQYSPDVLFGSEQISIGSLYTVRGFKESSLSADSGSYWRNDVSWIMKPQWGGNFIRIFMPYIGFDVGRIQARTDGDRYRSLKGWTLGLISQGDGWNAEWSLSRPIDAPGDLRHVGGEVSFSFNMSF